MIDTSNPDLSAFRARGGKILMWHGWADQLIYPRGDRLLRPRGRHDRAREDGPSSVSSWRPASGSGAEPASADGLFDAVVTGWHGKARLAARLADDAGVTRTRPLCPYPLVARHTGGDTNNAANFKCSARCRTSGAGTTGTMR